LPKEKFDHVALFATEKGSREEVQLRRPSPMTRCSTSQTLAGVLPTPTGTMVLMWWWRLIWMKPNGAESTRSGKARRWDHRRPRLVIPALEHQ